MAKLLTPKELAAERRMHVKSIYRLVERGRLRAVRLPGSNRILFDPDNLEVSAQELQEREEQARRQAEQVVWQHELRFRQRTAKPVVMPPRPPRYPKD